MRKQPKVRGTKQGKSFIRISLNDGSYAMVRKHKILLGLLIFSVLTWAIVSTIQMVKANEANQKKLKHDIEMQQILQERKTQDEINAQKDSLQKQIEELKTRVEAKKAQTLAAAEKAAQNVATRVVPHAQAAPAYSGSHTDWLIAAGIPSDQWQCANSLITKESGWRVNAYNPSGAYGIPQSLPGSKMASAGADWQTNPVTQLRWMLGYVNARYGSFCGAWAHSQAVNWY